MRLTRIALSTLLALASIGLTDLISRVQAQTSPNFSLSPASTSFAPGSPQTVQLRINTGTQTATSFVVAIDVTGTAVPTNLAFTGTAPSGMTVQSAVVNITGGKQIQAEYVGGAGSGTLNTNNTNVVIGNITFTTPSSGSAIYTLNTGISAIFAGSNGNVLTGGFTNTYSVTSTPTATPTQSAPTLTPVPPTNTPVPPTNTPVPTSPTTANLTVTFRMQGIVSNIGNVPVTLYLRTPNTTTEQSSNHTATAVAAADGGYTFTAAVPSGSFNVCLKTPNHLKRCFRQTGEPQVFTFPSTTVIDRNLISFDNESLRPGDVDGDNDIELTDVTTVINTRNSFRTPASGSLSDLNRDGFITIDDIALATLNYSGFRIQGD